MSLIPTIPMIWTMVAGTSHAALASGSAGFASFARAIAPGAVAALWQGTAIALVLGLCLRFASTIHLRLGAAQRFAVWATAFVIIAVLPFLPSFLPQGSFGHGAVVHSGTASPAQSLHLPFIQISESWAIGLAALWLAASLVRAAALVRHSIHLCRLWSSATSVVTGENLRGLLAAPSGSHRRIQLCATRELDRPSVIGFFAPRILIPEWLFSQLTADELEHVVLHEAEHLRRGDDWTNLLQKLVLVLFPLNPALIWIERRLCREREMACDDGVVRRTQAPCAYAASLANLAGHAMAQRRAHALSLGAFERRSELASRVSVLLARKPALHPIAARALVAGAACGLLAIALELTSCPQMVAFVPAAPESSMAQINTPVPQSEGDRVYAQPIVASSLLEAHALRAKAVMPAERMSSRSSYRNAPSGAKAVPLLQSMLRRGSSAISSLGEGSSSRQDLVAQQASASNRQMQSAAELQVVVFTAWEQIETRSPEPIADYDTSAAQTDLNDSKAAAQNPQRQHPVTQITVTRLIFWVGPRTTASNTAVPGPKSPDATTSESPQPLAPAPASGWLFFQL